MPTRIFTLAKWLPQSISRSTNYEAQVEMHQSDAIYMVAVTNLNMV